MSLRSEREGLFGQLRSVCQQHPLRRKILLSPKRESGRSLIEGLARRKAGAVGLEATTVQGLARRHAALASAGSEETILAGGAGRLLMAQVLNQAGETDERRVADATHRLSQIQELRHRDWQSDDGDLGQIFDRYESLLQKQGLLDGPALLRRATTALEDELVPEIEESVLILLPALTTYPDEARYVNALCKAARETFELSEPTETSWSEMPSTLYRREAPVDGPEDARRSGVGSEALRSSSSAEGPADVTPILASTPEVEIESTLREVKTRGLSLDEVEVAYVSSDPYLDLWVREARRLQRQFDSERLPVTFGGGLPPRQTRVGRSLLAYFQLVENGPESPRLVRMLRSHTLHPPDGPLTSEAAADVLAQIRPKPTQEGYIEALAAHAEDTYSSVDPDELPPWVTFIEALFEALPEETVSIEALASKAEAYLHTLGGANDLAVASRDADVSSLEVRAFDELSTNLKRIADTTGAWKEQAPMLARLLETMTSERYVGAEGPRPGALHLTPVQHAGYSGRKVLFVLGLDAVSVSEDLFSRPILPEGIEENEATATQAWAVEAALTRHTGDVVALCPRKQLDTGRTLQPSFVFSQLVEAFGKESEEGKEARPEGFAPEDPTLATSMSEYWLSVVDHIQAYDPDAIREVVQEQCPSLLRGRQALLARENEEPAYAGQLNPEGKPPLDLSGIAIQRDREKPLSASQLQRLAGSPYGFFFERVLGIDSPEEPALDDSKWLDNREYGSLVHEVLEAFMREREHAVGHGDWERLWSVAEEKLNEMKTRLHPPGPGLESRKRNQLRRDLKAFFRQECRRDSHSPWGFEWEFGYEEPFYLEVPGGLVFPFRGSVDRIDELEGGGYALWDYKTGKSDDYDPSNPLGDGENLQWDLYARAFEDIEEKRVEMSGYYFTSDEEHGFLLDLRHASSRETLDEEWEDLAAIFRQVGEGVFGRDFDGNVWTYKLDRLERVLKAGEHLTPRNSS